MNQRGPAFQATQYRITSARRQGSSTPDSRPRKVCKISPTLSFLLPISQLTFAYLFDCSFLTMESLLRQSKGMCPFLKKTSAATLRSMSTTTHRSPGGGAITNLQFTARRCPVMNKALAVQSARIFTRSSSKAATSSGIVKSLLEKKLHTSAEKKANVDTNMFRKAQGMS